MSEFPKLPKLESALLDALINAMPPDIAATLRAQVGQYNAVERRNRGACVDLHKRKWGSDQPVRPTLAYTGYVHLGDMALLVSEAGIRIEARVFASGGQISCVEYPSCPKAVSFKGDVLVEKVVVDDQALQLLRGEGPSFPDELSQTVKAALQEWWQNHRAYCTRRTCPTDEREQQLKGLGPLPADYTELSRYTDGITGGCFSVLAAHEVYEVDPPQGRALVLALIHDAGVLCVNRKPPSADVWFCDYEGGQPERMGLLLLDALERKLQRHGGWTSGTCSGCWGPSVKAKGR